MGAQVVRWPVEPLVRPRRGLEERLVLVAPVLLRPFFGMLIRRPAGSPLRRAVLTRAARLAIAANNRRDYKALAALMHPDIELRMAVDDPTRLGGDLEFLARMDRDQDLRARL
jgi:hypothetical protein